MAAVFDFPELSLGDTLPSFSFDLELDTGQIVESAEVCLISETERLVYRWATPISISVINNKLTMTAVLDTSEWPAGDMRYIQNVTLTGGVKRSIMKGRMKIVREPSF